MRAHVYAYAFAALLLLGVGLSSPIGAAAAVTTDSATVLASPATGLPPGPMRLADGSKLGDKFMTGKSGGRYGVGGTERDKAQGSKSKSKSKSKTGSSQGQQQPPVEKPQQ